MSPTLRTIVAVTAAAGLLASCTAKDQEAPPLSGPSELATSITVTASPDTLRQDGSSQSQIGVLARGSDGQAIRNLSLRLDVTVNGVIADYGQISSKNLITGSDGRATAFYTAPAAPVDPVDEGTVVQVTATPVGTDYANAQARSVSIRLFPPGVILPPNGTPTARFTFSPSAPVMQTDVTFDGSLSTDSDGRIVTYAWNFGDGTAGAGATVQHRYTKSGSYSVTLTVTDDRGLSASVTQAVAVTETSNPTADFAFSPTTPLVTETVFFDAAASRAAPGRTIVSYDWTFGNGAWGRGITASQAYSAAGTYAVTLTVTDDAGKTGVISKSVPVGGAGSLTARFSSSPTNPTTDDRIEFNATASSGVNRITSYAWTFGDGATGSGAVVDHRYTRVGTYSVTLTVTDDRGLTASVTQAVTVSDTVGPTADFVFSPTSPRVTETVFFNASSSRAATGRTIVNYSWAFGNGTTGTGVTTTQAFASAGTYSVTLTVTDDLGKRAVVTKTVTVTSLNAVFTFSPTNPAGAEVVWFDAAGSTGVNPIVTYAWDFGDGTAATGVRVPHSYGATCTGGLSDRSFVVRLTITDSLGVTATTTQTVTVQACR